MSKETKLGRLVLVENKNRKPRENKYYYRAWMEDKNGKNERPLIFTEKQIEVAERRAQRNVEDQGKRGWFQDLID